MLTPESTNCVGKKYGRLLVESVYRIPGEFGRTMATVVCDCGKRYDVFLGSLKQGFQKGCGCFRKHGHSSRRGNSRTYCAWLHMRPRCEDPKNKYYYNYGGRGIKIDPAWKDFTVFLKDMGECPPGHSIDRIDNDGNYEKSNCKWSDRFEQMKNTRLAIYATMNGITKHIGDWAKELGVHKSTIKYRIVKGLVPGEIHKGKPKSNAKARSA